MSSLLLHNARLILPRGIERGAVVIQNEQIAGVLPEPETPPTGFSRQDSIDLAGNYVAPGLIDIHIHGSSGVDVQATDGPGLEKLSAFLLTQGVTGYFATLVPTDERGYQEAIGNIRSHIERQNDARPRVRGARILGIHFEGPFVSEHRCGALHTRHFRSYDGDPRSIEIFTGPPRESTNSPIGRLMTLAPEIRGGLDLTRRLTASGVRVFIGHSQADLDILDLAAEAGARHITHFPNALAALHHRKPGAVAWGLVRDDVTMDCIADFHHVHPLMLRLMYKAKGSDQMALISDAIMPAGLGDGEFSVWGDSIAVRNGRTGVEREGGEATIAGSVITMREALKNIVGMGVPIHEAVKMATLVPARVSGLASRYGSIEAGRQADLVAFDENLSPRLAVMDGRVQRP